MPGEGLSPQTDRELLLEIHSDVRHMAEKVQEHTGRIALLEASDKSGAIWRARSIGIYIGVAAAATVTSTALLLLVEYIRR